MSNLRDKVRAGQFVITAEIVPPLSAAGTKLLHEALSSSKAASTINLTDAAAKTSMSSFAAAAILVASAD
jgi:5,10-methylenetetrahydrofolate reductase